MANSSPRIVIAIDRSRAVMAGIIRSSGLIRGRLPELLKFKTQVLEPNSADSGKRRRISTKERIMSTKLLRITLLLLVWCAPVFAQQTPEYGPAKGTLLIVGGGALAGTGI